MRQRLCEIKLIEVAFPGQPVGGQIKLLQSQVVFNTAYDPIFKDTVKACPHVRWNGQDKLWTVDLLQLTHADQVAVFSYVTSLQFLASARDRQLTVAWDQPFHQRGIGLIPGPGLFSYHRLTWDKTAKHYTLAPGEIAQFISWVERGAPGATVVPSFDVIGGTTVIDDTPPPVPPKAVLDKMLEQRRTIEIEQSPVALSGSYVPAGFDPEPDLMLAGFPPTKVYLDYFNAVPKVIKHRKAERELYLAQRQGLAFAAARIWQRVQEAPGAGGIVTGIIHDPGMGKTMTGVVFAKLWPFAMANVAAGSDEFPPAALPEPYGSRIERVVVICPERARTTWRDEFAMWTDRPTFRYGIDGKAGANWCASHNGVLIVGYASVIRESFVEKLGSPPFDGALLILDEIHYLTNMKSKRTQAIQEIAPRFRFTLGLSGTPMLARPVELFPFLQLADRDRFFSYWRYATRYCDAKKTPFGWDVNGKSNVKELVGLMKPLFHRARRENSGMPPMTRIPVPMDIADRDELNEQMIAAMLQVQMVPGAGAHAVEQRATVNLEVGASIRQLVYEARRDESIEWLVDWAKSAPSRKLLVFVWNKAVVADVVNGLTGGLDLQPHEVAGVTGDTSLKERDAVAMRFCQDDSLRFLVSTIGAMGDVYSLHDSCFDGVFVQTDWTPGVMKQAESRLGRAVGGAPVNWYYLCAANTVDERMLRRLLDKQRTFGEVVDGGIITADYDDVLQEILAWKAEYDIQRKRSAAAYARSKEIA